MLYLVQYDLNNSKDYASLIEEIKKSPGWAHLLLSAWGVSTTETAQQLYNRLHAKMDKDDYLLVVQWTMNADFNGWLPKELWDWIQQELQNLKAA